MRGQTTVTQLQLPDDPRDCGCVIHSSHGSCTDSCARNHCGYMKARQEFVEQETRPMPADAVRMTDSELAADIAKSELSNWWLHRANTESEQVVAKAIEYGSRDLVEIGLDLARCMDRKVTDQEAAELGVYFYLRGKMARWTEAVADGRTVSDDTLKDIGVYVRMAQRIRSHGGWPGVAA